MTAGSAPPVTARMTPNAATTPTRDRSSAARREAAVPRRPERIDEPRLVRAFRDLLAARGVTPARVYSALPTRGFGCERCLDAALTSLGLIAERVEPRAEERGLAEHYAQLDWHHDADEELDDPDAPTAGPATRFRADRVLGLYRLGEPGCAPDACVWLWIVAMDESYEVLIAAPTRERLRPLLGALHREDREHQRRAGLVLVGKEWSSQARRARVTWDELVLPPGMRDELRATVREFFDAAPLYRRHALPHRRGLLLSGPPGNGKTSVIRAIANDVDVPVVVATLHGPQDVHDTREAFERAAELAPAVLCFEDLDALVGDGPGLSQFLNLLDGLEPLEGVLVVATTNRPDRIDPAIAKRPSRFDRVFVVPEPELEQRRDYLARQLGPDAPPDAAARLAEATGGYSVAFLKELVLQARLAAVRRGDDHLRDGDLDLALASTREHLRLAGRGLEERGLGFGERA